ncbi:MAG: DUF4276 family protein [Phycisphaeraceae bacterium]
MVEGEGDAAAVPNLVNRLLTDLGGDEVLFVDPHVIKQAKVPTLVGRSSRPPMEWWTRQLGNALKRPDVAAVLLVTDGDAGRVDHAEYRNQFGTDRFCACHAARWLADAARTIGGGVNFSVAIVFAMQEYEAWLLASVASFAGAELSRGKGFVAPGLDAPAEPESIRGAKKALQEMVGAYAEINDQLMLTRYIDFQLVGQKCPSFLRLKRAIQQLVDAVRAGTHITSPSNPATPPPVG